MEEEAELANVSFFFNFISRLHEFLNRVTRYILVAQETSPFLENRSHGFRKRLITCLLRVI